VRRHWLLIAALIAGCDGASFLCHSADDCTLGGEAGICFAGSCAYPDASCPSGYRYAAGLRNGFAGECVSDDAEDEDVTGSDTSSGSSSSSSTSSSSTGSDASSEESSSSGEASSTTTPDASSTGDNATDESSSGSPIACEELGCAQCFECVAQPGGACAMLDDACEDGIECAASERCMHACAIKGLCIDDCCDYASDEVTRAHDLHVCRSEACFAACSDLPQPYCSE
jgi:hypothetical protein